MHDSIVILAVSVYADAERVLAPPTLSLDNTGHKVSIVLKTYTHVQHPSAVQLAGKRR